MGVLFAGPTPQDGISAYEIAVDNGFIGTEAQWLDSLVGPAGTSAYQLAVQNGYTGNISQWLASLVGPPGPAGATGPSGAANVGLPIPWDFGISAGGGGLVNMTAANGKYVKIGKFVTISGQITLSASPGTCFLPFPSEFGIQNEIVASVSLGSGTDVKLRVQPGSSTLLINVSGGAAGFGAFSVNFSYITP
jgi:hypothetical protein